MKNLLTMLTAILLTTIVFLPRQAIAQSPEKMNYQAVIRDSNGHVMTNQPIGMQISVLQGSASGTVVYTETQSLLSNANGLTSTEIGTGSIVFGNFSTIDWANGPFFLQIETDPTGGTNYTITGTNQLLSVPYAMYAKTADSLTDIDRFSWSTTGNAGTADSINFIGTTDNQPLIFKVNNVQAGKITSGQNDNTFYGFESGPVTIGGYNTAIGYQTLYSNTIGSFNTVLGNKALNKNTTGSSNTAIGQFALLENTTGIENTAIGRTALFHNTSGSQNTAVGVHALDFNISGSDNTAIGHDALEWNVSGSWNTAIGKEALYNSDEGNHNTAIGRMALYENDIGHWNTAIGGSALQNNYSDNNTAVGFTALYSNTIGSSNTACGRTALFSNTSGFGNTATGRSALYNNTEGDYNTAIGRNALLDNSTGDNNTGIGYDANVPNATGSNQVRIGNTAVTYAGIQVSWSITSDKIWKEQIRELPYGIDMLMQLKPVDYYRKNNDIKKREMGFIAQDVEALLNKMGYDDQGFLTKADKGTLSLRYNDFIALLTKGMQEQQEIIIQLKKEIEQQSAEKITQNNNYENLLIRIEQLEKNNNQ